ncbi:MAG: hypothetical protein PHN49_04890 [Candidatus Omnitrophica bacterium]|nr:hypothetical protein [Candidatus Omnitrophota bacterium]MDD5670957.1 hypothetical protein [Candidatus Omnitrophota bacterium]
MNIGYYLTHRFAIFALNVVLAVITFVTLWDASLLLSDLIENSAVIENLLEGVATIFVAYGVALEERDTLMKVFKLYPRLESVRQEATDKLCHFYGLSYLLIGLFMEVTIELVKLPYRILNDAKTENVIFFIGFLFCLIAITLFVKNNYLLLKLPHQKTAE